MNKLEEFIETQTKKQTKKGYKTALTRFFRVIDKQPDKYIETHKGNPNLEEIKTDILKFLDDLEKDGFAPKSKKTYFQSVKSFLAEYDIELKKKMIDKIKKKIGKPKRISDEIIPTIDELKDILGNADIREKAFFLSLISSGCRVGELCSVKLDGIHFKENPTRIFISGVYAKGGESRHTFISQEATETIKSYLKVRDKYLENKSKKDYLKHIDKKMKDDNRLFPFSVSEAERSWEKLLREAGLDDRETQTKKRRLKRHIHVLRKVFRTQMGIAINNPDIVEAFIGHTDYIKRVYATYTYQQLGKIYLKGESSLTIYGGSIHNSQKLEELEKRNGIRQKVEARLTDRIIELEEELKKAREKEEKQRKYIEDKFADMERQLEGKLLSVADLSNDIKKLKEKKSK